MKDIQFSFLILTWNRSNLLSLCLNSLLKNAKYIHESEIIVLDNGSTDDTKTVLSRFDESYPVKTIFRDKNYGLNSYKKLCRAARGKYIVTIDEDVIEFPPAFDQVFIDYYKLFPDYGYLSLDVIQNEYTNGAKPAEEIYQEDVRHSLSVQKGPAGGWCACFKRKSFDKIKLFFFIIPLSMKRGEDATLMFLYRNVLKLKHGVIKGVKCFHACGPYYAKLYGFLDIQILKFENSGLDHIQALYKDYKD